MRKFVIALATALLAGSAYADDEENSTFDLTPPHQMQPDKAAEKEIDKDASSYTPGQQTEDNKEASQDARWGASAQTSSRDFSSSTGSWTDE